MCQEINAIITVTHVLNTLDFSSSFNLTTFVLVEKQLVNGKLLKSNHARTDKDFVTGSPNDLRYKANTSKIPLPGIRT